MTPEDFKNKLDGLNKITELGYERSHSNTFVKYVGNFIYRVVYYENQYKYFGRLEANPLYLYSQKDIDNLQIAYNNLQRDLKELNNGSINNCN